MNSTLPLDHKPSIRGGWHGASAWAMAGKCFLSFLIMTFLSAVCVFVLPVTALWLKIMVLVFVLAACIFFQYRSGQARGERDCAWGESVYARQQKGENVSKEDVDRSFHPLKGAFATLIGIFPQLLISIVFALVTQRVSYQLVALPSWMNSLMIQSEFSDALGYYTQSRPMSFEQVLRVIDRFLLLPYFNVFSDFGNDVALLVERLSPLLVLIAPSFYAVGYSQGQKLRDAVNQSIRIGVAKKLKKQQREHKKRVNQQKQPKKPEQLI